MDFEFTADQDSLRHLVARWVEKGFDFPRRQALAQAGGFGRKVYGELAELGLTGLVVPESFGGMGFGPVEAMVVLEELGRGLVHAPFAAGAVVTPALLAGAPQAMQSEWLPRIASGEALVVLAHQERKARYRLDAVETSATEGAGGWTVSGQKSVVPAADEADAFIVPAHANGTIALFLVAKDAPGIEVRGYRTQDGGRAGELMLQSTPARLVTAAGLDALELAQDVGITTVCAEGVGLMDKMLALTVEYMNTRKQFGTTIASFQALRHRIADVKMQVELGRSISYYATLKVGEEAAQRRRALSQAKVQMGQSMRFVGQQCIQLHGGIGVTDEYVGSHYFKRLTMLELTWGDTLHHLGEVSARMDDTAGVFA